MKLARPNVFHPRIVLASCPRLIDGDGDDAGLVDALRRRGMHARWMSWDDPRTEKADLVILRATWDYPERREEFLAWTARVRNLLNAPSVVAWNSDKHYLRDLAAAGIATMGPSDPRVDDGGTALVFLGGEQAHAFTKGPILPPQGTEPDVDESGAHAVETLTPADPDFEVWEFGHTVLDAAASHLGIPRNEFLYARVDVIGGADNPVLLQLELIEPGLGWRQLDDASRELGQRSFALQVESACERLGLGPLSHRRP